MLHRCFPGTALCAWLSFATLAAMPSRCAALQAAEPVRGWVQVTVIDQSEHPVADVRVVLRRDGARVRETRTNANGKVVIRGLQPGEYRVSTDKQGFQPLESKPILVAEDSMLELEIVLIPEIRVQESVDVKAQDSSVATASSSSEITIDHAQAKNLPGKPATITEALPALPDVVRGPGGKLTIAGAAEQHNALIVNSIDMSDPGTGQFGLTVPVDSIEVLSVASSPFLAQYGGFTAGVVSAQTRSGGDKWAFELNDPFPEFRIHGLHVRGVRSATPHASFGGPVIKQKLYLAQALQYQMDKVGVRTLPPPLNETITTSVNSFTQADYIFSPEHTLTANLHFVPQSEQYANLDFFNPRPVTPNFDFDGKGAAMFDRSSMGNGLLQSTLAWQDFRASVVPQTPGEMIITPTGNQGSYFSQSRRHSFRAEWLESFAFHPIRAIGNHTIQVGTTVAQSENYGSVIQRPVLLQDARGLPLRRIDFIGGGYFSERDLAFSAYGQDHWTLSHSLALDAGTRIERQSITGVARFTPRGGFALSPFSGKTHTVLRGGAGLFFDYVPLSVFSLVQYPEQIVQTFSQPDGQLVSSVHFLNRVGGGKHLRYFTRSRRIAGDFGPYSIPVSVELEQQVSKGISFRAKYTHRNTYGLVTLNLRPLANGEQALMASGAGVAQHRELEITTRLGFGAKRSFFAAYARSSDRGNLNTTDSYLGNIPYPILNRDRFTYLDSSVPNRMLFWGEMALPLRLRATPFAEYRTGFPYSNRNALQNYVGTPNQNRFPTFLSLDLRVARDFQVSKKYGLRLSARGINLTNHFNPTAAHVNIDDPQFGTFFGNYQRHYKGDFDVLF